LSHFDGTIYQLKKRFFGRSLERKRFFLIGLYISTTERPYNPNLHST